ncbi:MAG: hypothetical protein MJ072_04270, partial [Clostridia bacterium]|nr:hypothetical protein [Clostridia bacterium]
YLDVAEAVFDYGENLTCLDGSMYNDANSGWRFTTTFHLISVIETLRSANGILSVNFKRKLEERAKKTSAWLYKNLDENSKAFINYPTANAYALLLSGKYFDDESFVNKSKKLIDYALNHVSENNLFYGEKLPHDFKSKKGCYAVDVGYNVEESIPAMLKYAKESGDDELFERLKPVVYAHFDFMLPDGGWDNSFGVRNNKWTYWGSRTSDGCAPALLIAGEKYGDDKLIEGAYRNTKLLDNCTHDGFLYGGPDYFKHGEYPCVHHLFEHINSIAYAVDNFDEKLLEIKNTPIPSEIFKGMKFYPEINTCRVNEGDYQLTVTDSDCEIYRGGHATGVAVTMLFGKGKPMIMGSVTDYVLVEPTNMQQTLDVERHRSLTPRIVVENNGKRYFSTYFTRGEMDCSSFGGEHVVFGKTGVATSDKTELDGVVFPVKYSLSENGLSISIENAQNARYILPIINGEVTVIKGKIES